MKFALLISLFLLSATGSTLCAQEQIQPDTSATSGLLLFGKIPLKTTEHPVKKTRPIVKLEMLGLTQKHLGLELECPINSNTSFILHASRQTLNKTNPHRSPGTYTHQYTQTDEESTTWILFVPITSHQSFSAPSPFENWGDFLPTSAYTIQPELRTYFGKKQSGSRFYWAPGASLLFLNGVTKNDFSELQSQTSTSTNSQGVGLLHDFSTSTRSTYRETRTVSGGKKRVTGGISLGFGYQANAGKRIVFDLGLDLAAEATKGWKGLKKASLVPLIQMGYRI